MHSCFRHSCLLHSGDDDFSIGAPDARRGACSAGVFCHGVLLLDLVVVFDCVVGVECILRVGVGFRRAIRLIIAGRVRGIVGFVLRRFISVVIAIGRVWTEKDTDASLVSASESLDTVDGILWLREPRGVVTAKELPCFETEKEPATLMVASGMKSKSTHGAGFRRYPPARLGGLHRCCQTKFRSSEIRILHCS